MARIDSSGPQRVDANLVQSAERWLERTDALRSGLSSSIPECPSLAPRLEALHHRRESVGVKLDALRRASDHRWAAARGELAAAVTDLSYAWRSVLNTLMRESVTI